MSFVVPLDEDMCTDALTSHGGAMRTVWRVDNDDTGMTMLMRNKPARLPMPFNHRAPRTPRIARSMSEHARKGGTLYLMLKVQVPG